MNNCRYYKDGKCERMNESYDCEPWKPGSFDEGFEVLDTFEEACEKSSIFGNSAVYITEEDIADLRKGKILMHDDGEYCTLVILRNGAENETENRKTMQA